MNYDEYFEPDNGSKKVDMIEVDSEGHVVRIGWQCTKENCNCVGGWWEETGKEAFGDVRRVYPPKEAKQ